jgi:hypothetical protein
MNANTWLWILLLVIVGTIIILSLFGMLSWRRNGNVETPPDTGAVRPSQEQQDTAVQREPLNDVLS